MSIRRGMTLVELLVVIVVMVTVLAAVIPMMSPNNEERRIREAARQIHSLISEAKAKASASGRPAGITFTESGTGAPYSGMATEVYLAEEPPHYSGFSDSSQARLLLDQGKVVELQFVLAGEALLSVPHPDPDEAQRGVLYPFPSPPDYLPADFDAENYFTEDPVPPGMLHLWDVINVGGFDFYIVDLDRNGDREPDGEGDSGLGPNDKPFQPGEAYTRTQNAARFGALYVGGFDPGEGGMPPFIESPYHNLQAVMRPSGSSGKVPPYSGWTTPRPYKVKRKPRKTSDAALQLPPGIGIDLQGSGTDGALEDLDGGGPDTFTVMFAPNGSVHGVYFDGEEVQHVGEHIHLLIGRIEDGNPSLRPEVVDFANYPPEDNEDTGKRMAFVNWLSPYATWVNITTNSGRVFTAEGKTIDPRHPDFTTNLNGTPEEQLQEQMERQIEATREYAEKGQEVGGR